MHQDSVDVKHVDVLLLAACYLILCLPRACLATSAASTFYVTYEPWFSFCSSTHLYVSLRS